MESRKCFSFMWILEKFSYCAFEKNTCLSSPTFVVDTVEKTKWGLYIHPRNIIEEKKISVCLRREEDSKGPSSIEIDYDLAFLSANGSIIKSWEFQNDIFLKNDGHGTPSFETRQNIFDRNRSTMAPESTLMIRCRMRKNIGEAKMDVQCIARTRFEVESRCFLWKTEKFSTFESKRKGLQIRSASSDQPIVSLKLCFQQHSYKKDETLSILLSSARREMIVFTLKVSLLDAKGNHVDCGQYEVRIETLVQKYEITLPLTKDSLMANSQVYLPNDVLTLLCDCTYSTGMYSEGVESISYGISSECANPVPSNVPFSQKTEIPDVKNEDPLIFTTAADIQILSLNEDIIGMYKENIQCDVKLSADNETFPSHWFILSARSPVFRAMFKSGMKEKSKDRIDIQDLQPDTVRRMLLYMYTDTLEELQWETALDLYSAADKYQILSLKDKCSNFLKTNISPTNACKFLVLADLHQDKDLKSIAQDFILKRDVDIMNSDDWKALMETNAHLAAETMFLKFKK